MEIPSHAWEIILPYLRQPIPLPRSKPPRSALRQPELCAASGVCRLFNSIVEPLLWSAPVTDNLSLFLHDFHLPSKQRLFARIRSLHIEYNLHGEEPSLLALFTTGRDAWKSFGLSGPEREEKMVREMALEVRLMSMRLKEVGKRTTLKRLFPKLETIAVASIYQVEDSVWPVGHWRRYEDLHAQHSPLLRDALSTRDVNGTFERLLKNSTLQHLCTRDHYGPLAISPMTFESRGPPSTYAITHHFQPNVDQLPIRFGGKTRWVSDAPSSTKWKESMWPKLIQSFHYTISVRSSDFVTKTFGRSKTDTLNITMYCSTEDFTDGYPEPQFRDDDYCPEQVKPSGSPRPPPPPNPDHAFWLKRTMHVSNMARSIQKMFRDSSGLKDEFYWDLSENAPVCEACGSRPPHWPRAVGMLAGRGDYAKQTAEEERELWAPWMDIDKAYRDRD